MGHHREAREHHVIKLGPFSCSDILNHSCIHGLLKTIVLRVHVERVPCVLLRLMAAGSLARGRLLQDILRNGLVGGWQEDDLTVSRLSHSLHGFEISDLHSWCRAENVGSLSHELGGFDFSTGSDDLGFTDTLGLCGHGERVLEVVAEDDVLDKHRLDLNTPAPSDILDDFTDGLGDFLAALNNVLEDTGTDNVTKGSLCALNEGLADVGNTESCLMRRSDVVVDD